MEFLPRTLGTRPRLACEVRAEGVVAARAEDASGVLTAISRVPFPDGIVVPHLRPTGPGGSSTTPATLAGGPADHTAVVSAIRKALDAVCMRTREVTLVVPDAAVRVSLLEFDALPSKPAEALPLVRFRLKKLLPFDADDAAVSYQVMSSAKGIVRVVAVAMPREVLAEYEAVVREASFEPGAVMPSTLAALAGLPEDDAPALVVNAGRQGVTTAIVKAGVLLLHRSVDLGADLSANHATTQATVAVDPGMLLPLVDRESSAEEWALQEPVSFGSPIEAAAAMQTAVLEREIAQEISEEIADEVAQEIAREFASERGEAVAMSEIVQAVSRSAAYFEDTLGAAPDVLLATGPMGAQALAAMLEDAGIGPVPVEEMVEASMLGPGAASTGASGRLPLGWLAGVRGALAD